MRYARVRPSVNQLEYTPMAPLLEELEFCEDHDIAISAFGWNEAFVLNQEELNVLAETLLPDAEFSRELLMKVLMRWYMAQGMVPLFRSSREEVLLDLAESLAISMPEEAIDFLRQPISEYPWQYYSGERPWNAAAYMGSEPYDANMMSMVLSPLLPPSPLRVGVQEKLRALPLFPVETVDFDTNNFNITAWYLTLSILWTAFLLYVTLEALALSSLMQYGLLGLGVHYGLDQWDEELNRTAIRRKVQSGIRSKFMDDGFQPTQMLHGCPAYLPTTIHVGSVTRQYGTYKPAATFKEGLSSADFSTQLPGRGPHYEVEMDEDEDEAEVVRQLAEKLSQEESPEALLDRAFFE
eukprot:symbB.v1.2.020571.t1/scaffold1736.1/size104137/3